MQSAVDQRRNHETSVLLSRHALFDRNANVFGYEVLPAERRGGRRVDPADDLAHTSQIWQALGRTGLENFLGVRPAFVKVNAEFLLGEGYGTFPPKSVFLQLDASELASSARDAESVDAVIQKVRRDGFRVGLNNVDKSTYPRGCVPRVDFLCFDVTMLGPDVAATLADEARRVGVMACARGVESTGQFEMVRDRFDLFQGFFYQRRAVSDGSTGISTGRLSTMQLLAECSNPDATLEDFESIIGRDPALTFRVLQLANSGFASLNRRLDSLREALITVGVNNVRNLAMIASLNRMEDQQQELLTNSLVRAKMCEILARGAGLGPAVAFTAGLLSLLDAFVGLSLADAVEKAALREDIKEAIVDHKGPLGEIVATSIAYEHAMYVERPGGAFTRLDVSHAFLDAVVWAQELTSMGV